ncbi:MAG: LTA synthase family protein [Synergistes sp.]|nr:LTA synthase family protein [Synergistes sp.]
MIEYKYYYANKKTGVHEIIFFALCAAALLIKFYFLEYEVYPIITRFPMSAAASAALVLLILLPISLVWRKVRFAAVLLVDFALTALIITDLLYMRFYTDLFTVYNLALAGQADDVSDSVFALLRLSDALYFVDFPILAAYFFGYRRNNGSFFGKITAKRVICTLMAMAISAAVVFCHITAYDKKVPKARKSMWNRVAVCNNVGALTYHLSDCINAASEKLRTETPSEEKIKDLASWYAENITSRTTPDIFGIAKGKNLIVIQAESLQSFAVGLKINGREVTPNINAFMRETSFARSVFPQTASGNSSDAEFLANTGFYPAASGVAYTRFASRTYKALPQALRRAGYVTIAMHGDRASFWNRHNMYPALGFDKFISKKDYKTDEIIGLGLSDRSFFAQSLEMLKAEKKPFYAFLVTLTSHYPFRWKGLVSPLPQRIYPDTTMVGAYIHAISYFDREFGTFIQNLKKSGLYDESVIILYGDHTAIPRGNADELARLTGLDLSKEHVWRSAQSVPLMIRLPHAQKLKYKENQSIGLANVPRTAAMILGVDYKDTLCGDIFTSSKMPVIFRNGAFATENIYVDPTEKTAFSLTDGSARPYGSYEKTAKAVKQALEANDMILEHDLMPVVSK